MNIIHVEKDPMENKLYLYEKREVEPIEGLKGCKTFNLVRSIAIHEINVNKEN